MGEHFRVQNKLKSGYKSFPRTGILDVTPKWLYSDLLNNKLEESQKFIIAPPN